MWSDSAALSTTPPWLDAQDWQSGCLSPMGLPSWPAKPRTYSPPLAPTWNTAGQKRHRWLALSPYPHLPLPNLSLSLNRTASLFNCITTSLTFNTDLRSYLLSVLLEEERTWKLGASALPVCLLTPVQVKALRGFPHKGILQFSWRFSQACQFSSCVRAIPDDWPLGAWEYWLC